MTFHVTVSLSCYLYHDISCRNISRHGISCRDILYYGFICHEHFMSRHFMLCRRWSELFQIDVQLVEFLLLIVTWVGFAPLLLGLGWVRFFTTWVGSDSPLYFLDWVGFAPLSFGLSWVRFFTSWVGLDSLLYGLGWVRFTSLLLRLGSFIYCWGLGWVSSFTS